MMLHEKGFSLMETVAALALFSIVSFAFLTGLCTLTKATVTTRDRAIAENLARNELEYVKTLSYQYGAAEYDVCPTLDIPAGWSVAPPVVEPVNVADDGLQRITVTIERNGEPVLSLFTYKVDR